MLPGGGNRSKPAFCSKEAQYHTRADLKPSNECKRGILYVSPWPHSQPLRFDFLTQKEIQAVFCSVQSAVLCHDSSYFRMLHLRATPVGQAAFGSRSQKAVSQVLSRATERWGWLLQSERKQTTLLRNMLSGRFHQGSQLGELENLLKPAAEF
jgi:hypothetical protein